MTFACQPHDLGVPYKSAFVLAHKLREAMAEEVRGQMVGGEGENVEIDGATFGHSVKPANHRVNRKDRRLKENQSGRRKFVSVARESGGRTIPAIFPSEAAVKAWLARRVDFRSTLHADAVPGWNDLEARFVVRRIDPQEAYALADACTNQSESFFSRIRRGEAGHHHHISGPCRFLRALPVSV